MADGGITTINLRGVRKLIDDKNIGESVLDAVDNVLGAVLALSPVIAGPVALPLLALIEPKNELVKLARAAIKAITRSRASDYLDQAERMAAANCLLTFTAYFDALGQLLPDLMRQVPLTDEDRKHIAADARPENAASSQLQALVPIPVPHPAAADEVRAVRLELYKSMSHSTLVLLTGLQGWGRLPAPVREYAAQLIPEQVPALADSVYEAGYLGMAVEYPQFFIWTVLRDQRDKEALIKTVGADLRTQFELVASALRTVDLGLEHLAAAIRQIPPASVLSPVRPDLGAVAAALHRGYQDEIERPIIDDRYEAGDGIGRLTYPSKVDCYVPQAYRVALYKDETTHLEREDEWNARPVHDDLGPFLMRHLESPYSVQTPLLILGHPGSGKSLLTQVIAARLAYPGYTTVRVELRDVNPHADIQAQIEAQIRKDTGRDVNWADFADNLAMSPPIVILDGYDELLQATGKLFADYLDQVRRFQHREAVQHRPVRVIVTSRITLIDKAIVPPGTTIVRLEEFDERRRDAWTRVWNARNDGYFEQARIQPFALPANDKVIQLAGHPLLLLMLALYDSIGNKLSSRPDIDQTLLYAELLARFIERELSKGDSGTAFTGLPQTEREAWIDREIERLGVAAIGMFNRQEFKVMREELNADLRYFAAGQGTPADGSRRMSQADLLLGSFFFIHESRSRLAGSAGPGTGPAAFEFLHNTFGEFLAADFILRKVIAEASAISALSGNADLEDPLRQRLAIVSPAWFACLIHTPLHTRPNILAMLREWSGHRLSLGSRPGAELLTSLDKIVVAQLRALLTQTSLPNFSAGGPGAGESPYRPSPVLGHLAIYSLNLVLLRCFLDEGTYTLDEADLGPRPGGCRPWDRLVSIWRSWFTLESLGALAMLCSATRSGTRIGLEPARSSPVVPNTTSLYTAYNVGVALADNLAAAGFGIHVASIMNVPEDALRDLRARAQSEVPVLIPVVDSMLPRMFGGGLDQLPDFLNGVTGDRLFSAEFPKVPGYMLNLVELADRMLITPRQRAAMEVRASRLVGFTRLSRYEAELAVRARDDLEARWLPHLLCAREDKVIYTRDGVSQAWRLFLSSPAAAPALRAGWRRLDPARCAEVAADAAAAFPDGTIEAFDVDTAAALAVLAWRGGAVDLCVRSVETITRACREGAWSLLDIPSEIWGGLADLFTSGDAVIANVRAGFAVLVDRAVAESFDIQDDDVKAESYRAFMEFWINALRIGATGRESGILMMINDQLSRLAYRISATDLRWVLLLMRWARENRDHNLVRQLFAVDGVSRIDWLPAFGVVEPSIDPAKLDTDKLSAELTYREAMDLRWVMDVLRARGQARR